MAELVGTFGCVYAFEADPDTWFLLNENIGMNWYRDRVRSRNLAVTDTVGELSFLRHRNFRGSSGLAATILGVEGALDAEEIKVAADRLDNLLPRHVPLRIVKVDVEGGEVGVLAGLEQTLVQGRINALDVEVIRGEDTRAWLELARWLRRLQEQFGGQPHLLGKSGRLSEASVDRIIGKGAHNAHVIFTFGRANA
jgi:FkbM family methyltransferase